MTHHHRVWPAAAALLFAIVVLGASPAAALGYRVERMLVPSGVAALRTVVEGGASRVLLFDADGNAFRLQVDEDGLTMTAAAAPAALPAPGDADRLPDGAVATGDRGIAAAWLTLPTQRYAPGVLGDDVEAGGLAVRFADGREARLRLGDEAVFEDLTPRLADVDGDGRDDILVVKSYLDRGAALAVVQAVDGELRIAAESPPLGQPHRWLNPVGAGDFDGDGRIEVAAVTTPHLGGTLRTYEMLAGRLVQDFALAGFSNHALGSRQLGLAAVLDVTGDGLPDLAVPTADRRTLKVVTLAGGRFRTVAAIAHAAAIATGIVVADLDGNGRGDMIYALENRFLIVVLWTE